MSLQSTDPEYTQRLGAFLEEVKNEPDSMLEPTTRWLAILAIPALVWRFAPGPVRLNLRATVLWLPWYLLACTLLPALLGGLAGELATVLAGVYLLPFGCLAIGMSLGKRHGLCPLFPVACALCLLIVVGKRTPALCLVPSISALLGNAAGAYPRERGGTG